MTTTRASVRRRPYVRAQGTHADRTRGQDGAATRHVGASPHRVEQLHLEPSTVHSADALLDAALAEPASGLPHAPFLERRFGQPLGWVRARNGPLTRQALDALGAVAATRGDTVFLRGPQPPFDVVAHEVTHALQARSGSGVDAPTAGSDGIVAEHTGQEQEAVALASPWWAPARTPVRPATALPDRAIALLRPSPATDPGGPTLVVEPAEPARAESARAATTPVPSRRATTAATGAAPAAPSEQGPERGRPTGAAGQQPPAAAETGEQLVLPPAAELTLSPEQVAEREATLAEAEAALAGAGDASAVLHAFADAPPTLKAREASALSGRLEPVVAADTQEWQSQVPALQADLQGETGAPPEPLRVQAPASDVDLEPEPVAAAPQPELAEVPEPPPFTSNDGITSVFARVSQAPPEQLAQTIGDSLSDVQTTDPSVPRSPGPPPDVPLAGETDPARIATQERSGQEQAAGAREAATRAVVDGPGPEQARPVELHESYPVEAVEPPTPATLAPPEGPQAYLALDLPPEVQTAFDQQQQAAMQESMSQATAQADEATAARDTARDEAVTTAQEGAAELNRTANTDQRTAVGAARTTIQDERQGAIDAQHGEVERVRGEAAARRETDKTRIDTQVATEQKAIDDRYVQGESDIADEIAEGERQARDTREQAERDAENESWWDRAVSFVKDAFDALVDAIGSIFDAVRDAVNTVLDAVKDFALSVIDRVASFVKDAIAAFGEFLKSAVDALIGSVFPELADALNAAIDSAVAVAQAAVDVVADKLKAGVSALVETLRAGINAALDAFEAGISLAVTFVGAALTGDWGMLARKVLESVLRLVGVAPETFYAFVGRAAETFDRIVHDPLGFLSNLVSAVVGGVQAFADRFVVHLRGGVLGWLTGTLGGAGIVLPPAFDLAGVLDLARQILGLTWDMIRTRAVRLLGAQNVERLEFLGEYVDTLVTAGWPGLWEKLKADLGGLVDTVFDAITSFLLDRVVLAMVKKIPMLFTPAGAIVQLVLTAWNLYEFLRDQLSRIVQVVQAVVDSVGDIARGVLVSAIGKVQEVLGQLLPIALDLLARLLGLGNLGEDVRKVIDRVRETIDRAVDGLLRRVVGLFTGAGRRGAPPAAAARATAQPEQQGGADDVERGQVKRAALVAADEALRRRRPESLDEMGAVIDEVYRGFRPQGLRRLWFDVTNETTLAGRLLAAASEPEQRVVAWSDIFDPLDPARLLFMTQPRNETHAAISVDGVRIGEVQASDETRHAEENLVEANWGRALDAAQVVIDAGGRPRLSVAINRAPCHTRCTPFLVGLLADLDPTLKRQIDFVLAPTGVYEPTERLTDEAVEQQRAELREVAERIGRAASAVIREQLNKVVMTEDTTTYPDLRRLVGAGWDLRQLQARPTQTAAGRILAEAAHKVAVEAEQEAKAGAT